MDVVTNTTSDNMFNGQILCQQHKYGYRFSIDSVLVAHFLEVKKDDRILDLGCGCGIIGLILSYRWKNLISSICGFELQPALAELATTNVAANGLCDLFSIIKGDLRHIGDYIQAETFSQIVCNPPFYKKKAGRSNQNLEAFIARHQVESTLDEVLFAAAFCVKNKGKVIVIFPADSLAELIFTLKKHRLEPKRLQLIYSRSTGKEAQLVIVEARKNGGEGLKNLPPFYIYRGEGRDYTEQMERQYTI